MGTFSRLVLVLLALLSFSLTPPPAPAAEWRDVTDDRLANAGSDPADWLMYSRTYNGWRYSPLDQINTGNIKKLVPKWIFAGGVLGEQQMTPVVNSGAMFTTSTALGVNRVHALNAVTGELLWKHDRKIPEDVGALVRVIPHNRGVALHKDKVIFGTLDAHRLRRVRQPGSLDRRHAPGREPVHHVGGCPRRRLREDEVVPPVSGERALGFRHDGRAPRHRRRARRTDPQGGRPGQQARV